jgi:hypothetical protein
MNAYFQRLPAECPFLQNLTTTCNGNATCLAEGAWNYSASLGRLYIYGWLAFDNLALQAARQLCLEVDKNFTATQVDVDWMLTHKFTSLVAPLPNSS